MDEWESWKEIFDQTQEETVNNKKASELLKSNIHISVEKLNFSYPQSERKILKDISFTINNGELVVLVGSNGAGKSTLLKLLLGSYEPSSGHIQISGKEPSFAPLDWLSKHIAMVFQKPLKYPVSLRENCLLSAEAEFPTDIHELLRWYMNESELDTPLLSEELEGGGDISGGQWQWVAIARALAKRPELFLFDEPTSAMSPMAERDIFLAFRKLTKGKTTVVSTHRLGFAMEADRIIVLLPDGTIEAIGTHAELLKSSPTYKELYTTQSSWYNQAK